jgi:translation initiation factor IF-1
MPKAVAASKGIVRAQLPSGFVSGRGRQRADHGARGRRGEKNFVRLLIGDRVVVELTPRDLTRGRIVRKV